MANRKSNSPWGSSYKEGLPSTAVNDTVDIDQNVRATISTGVIDVATGQWEGNTLSDKGFIGITKAESVANSSVMLFPDTNEFPMINCDGYTALQFALKSTESGQIGIRTVFGPNTQPFLNLSPVTSGVDIKITDPNGASFEDIINDTNETVYADSWTIWTIASNKLAGQANLQMRIVNSTGSTSDFEFAFRRLV